MDVILVGFVGGFVFGGRRTGFLRRLVGIAFVGLSFILSAYFRYPIGTIASTFFKSIPPDYAQLVGYTIAFPAVLAMLHLASRKSLSRVQVTGITKELDHGLGALFGGVEAILIISVAVVVVDAYFGTSSTLAKTVGPGAIRQAAEAFNASVTVTMLRGTTVPTVLALVGPLLPKDISTLLPGGLPQRIPFPVP
jgi:uncharacterized membrane protein required for colicin V production